MIEDYSLIRWMPSNSYVRTSGVRVGISRWIICGQIIGYVRTGAHSAKDSCLPKGVYVLQDNAFKPIQRISSWEGRADAIRRARIVSDKRRHDIHSIC